jgi:hypothetical protein
LSHNTDLASTSRGIKLLFSGAGSTHQRPVARAAAQRSSADLDRLNRNPFLNIDAVFEPGAQISETDVKLKAPD